MQTQVELPTITLRRNGHEVRFVVDNPQEDIQRKMLECGDFYEAELLDALAPHIDRDGTIVDVGANIGTYTIYFAAFRGNQVVAFEPFGPTADLLERNIRLNELADRVTLHRVGLGAEPGRLRIAFKDLNSLPRARLCLEGTAPIGWKMGGDVTISRLDDYELPGPLALLKIDVEGGEIDVLRGALRTIRQYNPPILIEILRQDHFDEILEILSNENYSPIATWTRNPTILFLKDESPIRESIEQSSIMLLRQIVAIQDDMRSEMERMRSGRIHRFAQLCAQALRQPWPHLPLLPWSVLKLVRSTGRRPTSDRSRR